MVQVLLKVTLLGLLLTATACAGESADSSAQGERSAATVDVVLETSLGQIEIELFVDRAPLSSGSFLKFLDDGRYNGGVFNRVVRPDNDNGNPIITVIQGGVPESAMVGPEDAVPHETTRQTGILHTNGVVSLARSEPGSGGGAAFFICIGDQPSLDFGGTRNADGQGFAAFGRVTGGMDVVEAINEIRETRAVDDPYVANQMLAEPVVIQRAYRKPPQ